MPGDPVLGADLRLNEAQAAYDAAKRAGTPLSAATRRTLAVRLALARSDFRAAIHGYASSGEETRALAHALPAFRDDDLRDAWDGENIGSTDAGPPHFEDTTP